MSYRQVGADGYAYLARLNRRLRALEGNLHMADAVETTQVRLDGRYSRLRLTADARGVAVQDLESGATDWIQTVRPIDSQPVIIGDSIAAGSFTDGYSWTNFPGWGVHTTAYGGLGLMDTASPTGTTVDAIYGEIPHDEFNDAIVALGTNDCLAGVDPDMFLRAAREFRDWLRSHFTRVWFCTIVPFGESNGIFFPETQIDNARNIRLEINERLRDQFGPPNQLLDLDPWSNHMPTEFDWGDGVHPNIAGQTAIGEWAMRRAQQLHEPAPVTTGGPTGESSVPGPPPEFHGITFAEATGEGASLNAPQVTIPTLKTGDLVVVLIGRASTSINTAEPTLLGHVTTWTDEDFMPNQSNSGSMRMWSWVSDLDDDNRIIQAPYSGTGSFPVSMVVLVFEQYDPVQPFILWSGNPFTEESRFTGRLAQTYADHPLSSPSDDSTVIVIESLRKQGASGEIMTGIGGDVNPSSWVDEARSGLIDAVNDMDVGVASYRWTGTFDNWCFYEADESHNGLTFMFAVKDNPNPII